MSYITLYSVTDLIKRNDTNRPCNRIQSGLISSENLLGQTYFPALMTVIRLQILDCDVRFVCDVGCNPKPDITWSFNGKTIEDGGRYKIKNNGNTRMLMIKKITEADAGEYK